MGRLTSQVRFSFVSGGKNDHKNTKILKKSDFFVEIFLKNILIYFKKFSAKILRFWTKIGWFYKILAKLKKKNLPKWEKNGSVAHVKHFFFVD